MAGIEILEGFLCPICLQDLGSVVNLQEHFELAHSAEDSALLNQLKGLFGKAKRKLLGKEIDTDNPFATVENLSITDNSSAAGNAVIGSGIDPSLWEPQELVINSSGSDMLMPTGVTRSLTDYLKTVRGSRIDRYVIETNKLVIRLDKLVNSDANMDPAKRKAFEKTVVHWAPDADVNLCTTCGKSFTLTRRRHHCRLCGRILCNKCSHFLPFDFAKKLTNPAFSYEGDGFRRSSSNSSLNSMFAPEGELHIRTCKECRTLLERRDEQTSRRSIRPLIVQLYERCYDCMTDAENLLSQYVQMANSLNAGDTTFSLHEAQELRHKLTKLYENIAALSKRISVLGLDSPEPPTPKALRLQQMIAARASAFIQENLVGLTSLPTEEELVRLKEAKRAEAMSRIAEERRLEREQQRRREEAESAAQKEADALAARTRILKAGVKFVSSTGEGGGVEVLRDGGWTPAEAPSKASQQNNCDDPMIQQMNIIRSYIRQARDARRWDEVQMLEENLKELQREYWAQHETT